MPPPSWMTRETLVLILANTLDLAFCQGSAAAANGEQKTMHKSTFVFHRPTVPKITVQQYLQR